MEGDAEVLRVRPHVLPVCRVHLFKEVGLLPQDLAQLGVVEQLGLVDVGQLLADWYSPFPIVGLFEVLHDLQVQVLLAFPLSLTRIPAIGSTCRGLWANACAGLWNNDLRSACNVFIDQHRESA